LKAIQLIGQRLKIRAIAEVKYLERCKVTKCFLLFFCEGSHIIGLHNSDEKVETITYCASSSIQYFNAATVGHYHEKHNMLKKRELLANTCFKE